MIEVKNTELSLLKSLEFHRLQFNKAGPPDEPRAEDGKWTSGGGSVNAKEQEIESRHDKEPGSLFSGVQNHGEQAKPTTMANHGETLYRNAQGWVDKYTSLLAQRGGSGLARSAGDIDALRSSIVSAYQRAFKQRIDDIASRVAGKYGQEALQSEPYKNFLRSTVRDKKPFEEHFREAAHKTASLAAEHSQRPDAFQSRSELHKKLRAARGGLRTMVSQHAEALSAAQIKLFSELRGTKSAPDEIFISKALSMHRLAIDKAGPPDEARDDHGRWTDGGGTLSSKEQEIEDRHSKEPRDLLSGAGDHGVSQPQGTDKHWIHKPGTNTVLMPPKDFLDLAMPFGALGGRNVDEASIKHFVENPHQKNPVLSIKKNDDGTYQVGLHDGRHRALAAMRRGDQTIGVDILRGQKLARENPHITDANIAEIAAKEQVFPEHYGLKIAQSILDSHNSQVEKFSKKDSQLPSGGGHGGSVDQAKITSHSAGTAMSPEQKQDKKPTLDHAKEAKKIASALANKFPGTFVDNKMVAGWLEQNIRNGRDAKHFVQGLAAKPGVNLRGEKINQMTQVAESLWPGSQEKPSEPAKMQQVHGKPQELLAGLEKNRLGGEESSGVSLTAQKLNKIRNHNDQYGRTPYSNEDGLNSRGVAKVSDAVGDFFKKNGYDVNIKQASTGSCYMTISKNGKHADLRVGNHQGYGLETNEIGSHFADKLSLQFRKVVDNIKNTIG